MRKEGTCCECSSKHTNIYKQCEDCGSMFCSPCSPTNDLCPKCSGYLVYPGTSDLPSREEE